MANEHDREVDPISLIGDHLRQETELCRKASSGKEQAKNDGERSPNNTVAASLRAICDAFEFALHNLVVRGGQIQAGCSVKDLLVEVLIHELIQWTLEILFPVSQERASQCAADATYGSEDEQLLVDPTFIDRNMDLRFW